MAGSSKRCARRNVIIIGRGERESVRFANVNVGLRARYNMRALAHICEGEGLQRTRCQLSV